MLKIYCALSNKLNAFSKPNALAQVNAMDLTLVRIYKEEVLGLTLSELKSAPDILELESYGRNPENQRETESLFSDCRGKHLSRSGLFFKVMNSLEDVSAYFQPPPASGLYHVLVVIRQQQSKTQPVFKLESDYRSESGLTPTKLVLYCRKSFHDQFQFLRERVIRNSRFGRILGPPGTGTSATSLAFVSVMANDFPDWTVTWIHVSNADLPLCVRFSKSHKWSYSIKDMDMSCLITVLDDVEGKHIVFLDGFDPTQHIHNCIHARSSGWRRRDPTNRRLAVVCSTSSSHWGNMDDDKVHHVEEFFVDPWRLEEYLTAAQHIDEWESSRKEGTSANLQAGAPARICRQALV
ncbi:hypothetical protein HDU81_004106 [Chytriomyces hyalinus]|nr:hypothetical protein HDU81_004106 [Chytriomyces hyalinus]